MLAAYRRMSGLVSQVRCNATLQSVVVPEVHLGTMTFGWSQASKSVDDTEASEFLEYFISAGGVQIDTARIYSGGKSEEIFGRWLQGAGPAATQPLVLSTKAHPSQAGGLSEQGIRGQLKASLEALKVNKVDVLYLHQPDPENDLEESVKCVQDLIKESTIKRYGLSNYSALEVDRLCLLCKEKNWQLPSVCQGLFNPLNRWTEDELLPILRKHNIAFIAYNPLAAGLLTGKHQPGGDVLQGRFKNNDNYLPRFYTESNFKAMAAIQEACAANNMDMVSATFSWLLRHSCLDGTKGDGILLGASSMDQLKQNMQACCDAKECPPVVVDAFNAAWSICKESAFPYWRSYSKDQAGRENLPPGASYDAKKK